MGNNLAQTSSFTQKAWQVIAVCWNFLAGYVNALPPVLRFFVHLVFYMGLFCILAAHAVSIKHNVKYWKPLDNSSLTCGYFSGTGKLQCSRIYSELLNKCWDKSWPPYSFAGLGDKLGKTENPSRLVLFGLSLVYIPLAVLGFFEMLVRVVFGSIYTYLIGFAHRLLLLFLGLINMVLTPVWVLADKIMRAEQHCTYCYSSFKLPIYRCPKCGRIHKDLKPGKAGLLVALCSCGHFIPCNILSGQDKLDALCPKCGKELAASNANEFSIIVLGGNTSGKTALLAAFQRTYLELCKSRAKVPVTGKPSEEFDELNKMYLSGTTVPSSQVSIQAYSLVHSMGRGRESLVLYDVPDEVILEEENFEKNPLNFGYSDGFVLIMDPFSENSVREASKKTGELPDANSYSLDTFEEIVVAFIQQFSRIASRSSNKMINTPVAVIINKSDISVVKKQIGEKAVRDAYLASPERFHNSIEEARNTVCRNYLIRLGLSNALNNLESVFSNVQYFSASAMGHPGGSGPFSPQNVIAPFSWLAEQRNSCLTPILLTVQSALSKKGAEFEPASETAQKKTAKPQKNTNSKSAREEPRSAERSARSAAQEDPEDSQYRRAKALMERKQYREAFNEFHAIKEYRDARSMAIECLFCDAEQNMNAGNYEEAVKAYSALGKYRGSDKKKIEATYRYACETAEGGDCVSAFNLFGEIVGYKDSTQRMKQLLTPLIRNGVTRNLLFGDFRWRVLSLDKRGFALLLSEDVLFLSQYHMSQTDVAWDHSGIRVFLNDGFLSHFDDKEKQMMFPTMIKTAANEQYGTPGGAACYDAVFLLSVEEARRYLLSDRNPEDGSAKNYWCWLRTPGKTAQYAAVIDEYGNISSSGMPVDDKGGVRPAIWISL